MLRVSGDVGLRRLRLLHSGCEGNEASPFEHPESLSFIGWIRVQRDLCAIGDVLHRLPFVAPQPEAPAEHRCGGGLGEVGIGLEYLTQPELVLVDGAGDLARTHRTIDRVAVGKSLEDDGDTVFRRHLLRDEIHERLLGRVALGGRYHEGSSGDLGRRLRRGELRYDDRRGGSEEHDHGAGDPGPATARGQFEAVVGHGTVSGGWGGCAHQWSPELVVVRTRREKKLGRVACGVVSLTSVSPMNCTRATRATRMIIVASITPLSKRSYP